MNSLPDPADNQDPSIGFDLEGEGVTLKLLIEGAGHLLGILEAVDRSISGSTKPSLDWVITGMQSASVHVTVRPKPRSQRTPAHAGRRVIQDAAQGVESIQRGLPPPAGFPQTAVVNVLGLVALLDHKEVTAVSIRANDRPIAITRALAIRQASPAFERLESVGGIEGTIETMSVHGQNYFNLFDVVTGDAIKCTFPRGLFPDVYAAFGKRAMVSGTVIRVGGVPKGVKVQSITPFDPDEKLIPPEKSFGILRRHG